MSLDLLMLQKMDSDALLNLRGQIDIELASRKNSVARREATEKEIDELMVEQLYLHIQNCFIKDKQSPDTRSYFQLSEKTKDLFRNIFNNINFFIKAESKRILGEEKQLDERSLGKIVDLTYNILKFNIERAGYPLNFATLSGFSNDFPDKINSELPSYGSTLFIEQLLEKKPGELMPSKEGITMIVEPTT